MYIHESGATNKPIILFLHGNGSNGRMWKDHMNYFAGYHCLAPDFPGFGNSSQQEWVSLEKTTGEIIDLIRQRRNGSPVHIVGLSLGGSVATVLLSKAPELIDHAVVDGAGVLPLPGLGLMKIGFHLLQPFLKTGFVIRMIAGSMKVPPQGFDEFQQGMRSMSSSSFTRSFLQALTLGQPANLDQVKSRVLFAAGEKEPDAVRQSNAMLASGMPNAGCCTAPKMGHGWLAEAPELHCRMVEAWLNDQPLPSELLQ